jgi:hypothetical protein
MWDFTTVVGDLGGQLWAAVPVTREFWSGVIGAVFGGGITFLAQSRGFREQRKQRAEDRLRWQLGLAHSLFFKMMRIHSDFYGVHRHIEDCFEKAASEKFGGSPWQFVLPLANFADAVHFSPDEMSMLLGLKDIQVFNMVMEMDVRHNAVLDAARVMSAERRALTQRLEADAVEGARLSGVIDPKTRLLLMPKIIEVDGVIAQTRNDAKSGTDESYAAMDALQKLLKARLDVPLRFESNFKPSGMNLPGHRQ